MAETKDATVASKKPYCSEIRTTKSSSSDPAVDRLKCRKNAATEMAEEAVTLMVSGAVRIARVRLVDSIVFDFIPLSAVLIDLSGYLVIFRSR